MRRFHWSGMLLIFLLAAACSQKLESAKPAPGVADPQIVCNEQLTKTLVLTGDKFSPTVFDALTDDEKIILPEILLNLETDLNGTATSPTSVKIPDDPTNPAASRVRWQSQMRMTFDVFPELDLAPGVYSITVRNASGEVATAANALAVVPRPSVSTIVPDVVCTEQYENMVTVNGTAFLKIGDTLPTVAIGPNTYVPAEALGCTGIAGPVTSAELCTGLRVAIPQGDLDSVSAQSTNPNDVVVTNPVPAECKSTDAKRLTVFPRPRVAAIAPEVVCTEQFNNQMTITGTDFLVVAGAVPSVKIGAQTYVPTTESCTDLSGFDETVRRCSVLKVTVAQGDLGAGAHRVEVTNPTPVQCRSTDAVDLTVVPRPVITAIEPELVCREQLTNQVKITGTGFLTVDTGTSPPAAVPEVTIGAQTFTGMSVVPTPGTCTVVPGLPTLTVQTCTELVVTVPAGSLVAGPNAVTVRNPIPAACQSTDPFNLVAVDRPMITGISRPALCVAQADQPLTIAGSGFLKVGAEVPTVTIARADPATSQTYTPDPTTGLAGCTALTGVSGVQVCSAITITVPMNDLPVGTYTLTVRNPEPAACQSTDSVTVEITSPPLISGVAVTGVDPPRICETGGSVIITGSGFQDGAASTLSLGGVAEVTAFANVVATGGMTLTSSFGSGLMASDSRYTLTVNNPDGCSTMLPDAIRVTRGIFTFYADPSVVYNGINTKVTILATGIDPPPTGTGPVEVRLVDSQGGVTSFTGAAIDWGGTETPPRPQRVRITIPQGFTPGVYSVGLSDGTGCVSFLQGALTVVAVKKLALTDSTPPFGFQNEDTALTLFAKATADLGVDEVNFAAVPRVYLSKAGGAGTATEARAVTFVNATRITAVSPNLSASLEPGDYDIIVVNPTGEVGVLSGKYKVTPLAPPIIDTVTPGTLRTNPTPAAAFISGANFRQPSVRFTCRFPGGDPLNDVFPTITVNQMTVTSTQIDITVDMAMLDTGMICVVRVTNGDDGSYFDFSAVGVANPSQGANPLAFVPGPNLLTARRAPSGGSARVTRTARFLYAVGGDSGTAGGALSSVEAAPVGLFGDLDPWFPIPIPLTEGNPATGLGPLTATQRTLAGMVRVGGFFFLVGGHDGTAPTAKVLRAQILLPTEAPLMGDPDLSVNPDLGKDEGLPTGLWVYRISAVLKDNQNHNPGGETLASEPLLVRVPQVDFPPVLRVCWKPPTAPAGVEVLRYRIYRTVMPNQVTGQEKLLAECNEGGGGGTGCTNSPLRCYDDVVPDAAGFLDATRSPLPLGSTGVWHEMAEMGAARAGVGVATVRIPPAAMGEPERAVIYAAGGSTNGTSPVATYEYFVVNADGSIPMGAAWVPGTGNNLPGARSEHQLMVANGVNAPKVGGSIFVYAGGGNGPGQANKEVHAALVNPTTGALGSWTAVDSFIGGGLSGYAAAVSNNFLYVAAGLSGNALDDGADKAEINDVPPDLINWNASPVGGLRVRYLPGSAIQSSFWYLFGGSNVSTNSATKTTDLSVFGGQ